jgi:hypothetical protein
MSRKSRSQAKDRRLKDKRAKKETERAKYKGYAEQGVTKGSKRARMKRRRQEKKLNVIGHPLGPCGNVGCSSCSDVRSIRKER